MNVTDVKRRRNDILEIVVEAYVTTASPVGSELICKKLRQSLSSATIRHVMVELEKDGLLEQPHTSAGRVPTDRGYRYYVNSLMNAIRLSSEEARSLAVVIHPKELEVEELLERASDVLSQLSHQAALVVAPTVRHTRIRQIELLPIGLHKLLCVLVGQETLVSSHVIDVEEPLSRDEASSLAHFLNTELVGLPTQELLASLERRLLSVSDSFYYLVKRSLVILQTALATEPEEQLLIEGTRHLFEQPEVRRDPQKAQALLHHLESPDVLRERLREDLAAAEGTRVRIGREVAVEGLEDWSYVLSPFHVGRTTVGGVGVLGPKRMDYPRMCALVEGMAELVTDILTQWGAD